MVGKKEISVVVPVYQAENTLTELSVRLDAVFTKMEVSYELILVDDGSTDDSWGQICTAHGKNRNIVGIRLSRNFGQHYAIHAGLEKATGNWIVVMDCDLQDIPEEIPKLHQKTAEGYDMVLARRSSRKDGFFKKMCSRSFYRLLSYFTNTEQDSSIANFGMYDRDVIRSVLKMGDHVKVFPIMVQWVGFKKVAIDVNHGSRKEGKSTYTIGKLIGLAFNIIVTFSNKPLKITITLGLFISVVSMLVGLFYLIRYLYGGISVQGYTSLILSIWFLSGIIVFSIGVLGLYLGKIFDKVKSRPTYIVKETLE